MWYLKLFKSSLVRILWYNWLAVWSLSIFKCNWLFLKLLMLSALENLDILDISIQQLTGGRLKCSLWRLILTALSASPPLKVLQCMQNGDNHSRNIISVKRDKQKLLLTKIEIGLKDRRSKEFVTCVAHQRIILVHWIPWKPCTQPWVVTHEAQGPSR